MPLEARRRASSRPDRDATSRRNDLSPELSAMANQASDALAGSRSPKSRSTSLMPSILRSSPRSRPSLQQERQVSASAPDSFLADIADDYILFSNATEDTSPVGISSPRSNPNLGRGATYVTEKSSSGSHARSASARAQETIATTAKSTSRNRISIYPSKLSPSNLRPSPPGAGAHASGSSSRKSAGTVSDGGGLSFSPLFDMKRLLSKPAAPSHSGSSIASLHSDSEASASGSVHKTSYSPVSGPSAGLLSEPNTMKHNSVDPKAGLRLDSSHSSGVVPQLSLGISGAEPSYESEAPKKRRRNTLKRKPSAGMRLVPSHGSRPSISAPLHPPPSPSRAQAHRTGAPHLTIDPSYGSQSAQRPNTAPFDRYSPTRTRRPSAGEEHSSRDLTPAGAVAAAYKQQEQRRAKLASMTSEQDDANESSAEGFDRHDGVLLSASGRVLAVGSPEEGAWSDPYASADDRSKTSRTSRSGSGTSLRRSLSSKMSGRFKRGTSSTGGDVGTKSDPTHPTKDRSVTDPGPAPTLGKSSDDGGGDRSKTLSTLQERRRASLTRARRESLRLSIDAAKDREQEPPMPTGRSLPGRGFVSKSRWIIDDGGKTDSDEEHTRGRAASRTSRLMKPKSSKGEATSPGGKIWKVMKRISTGGLRERYHSEEPPPPVPAIPKDLLYASPISMHEPPQSAQEAGMSPRTMRSRSPSGGRKNRSPVKQQRVCGSTPTSQTSPAMDNKRLVAGHRPSTATRSSSPISSDVASTSFFKGNQSARSSTSSYVEVPPMPSAKLGNYILSPSELYRLNHESTSPSRTSNTLGSSEEQLAQVRNSLPCPPRRLGGSGREISQSSGTEHSPVIPTFSNVDLINTFTPVQTGSSTDVMGRKSSSSSGGVTSPMPRDEFGIGNAPPRPSRSLQRPKQSVSSASTSTSSSQPLVGSEHRATARSATLPPIVNVVRSSDEVPEVPTMRASEDNQRNRDSSHSSVSTAKPRPRSSSLDSLRHPDSNRVTFRELGSESQSKLTEKEKADKWDDLLERSALAGGTIRVGGSGLMSDNLRFSNYSEI